VRLFTTLGYGLLVGDRAVERALILRADEIAEAVKPAIARGSRKSSCATGDRIGANTGEHPGSRRRAELLKNGVPDLTAIRRC
jgi:hypothetical protein